MEKINCSNRNHGSMNVSVRYCTDCGRIVGERVPAKKCTGEVHSKKRRERCKFCPDCGERIKG